jgi:hypothetical protein
MKTPMFDPEALTTMVANATALQGEQLRKGVAQATLAALQGRELTLKNIKSALESVGKATSLGAARNNAGTAAEDLLARAVEGMDDALLKAVQAQQIALDKLVAQGADLRDKPMQKALSELEKIEDAAFATLAKVAAGAGAGAAGDAVAAAWAPVLAKFKESGLAAGGLASGSAAQFAAQWQEQMAQAHTMMKAQRAASLRAAQVLAESFGTLASGVLIGLSDALHQGGRKKG